MVKPMEISTEDYRALVRDKYNGDQHADLSADIARLAHGEPLAYVIGWQPFLGLAIDLSTRPLIPRPETEWWTELLIQALKKQYPSAPFTLLDLCSGSGAIGLAVAHACPNASVVLSDIEETHRSAIEKTMHHNALDASRIEVVAGDLFAPVAERRFNIIATNPPYVPDARELPQSVSDFEPAAALFAGSDGLSFVRRIAREAPAHLLPGGMLWLECDTTHTGEAEALLKSGGASSTAINEDLYGRPRIVVSYYA